MRVLIWVQHLLGTGHFKRIALLADKLAYEGFEVIIVSGGTPTPWLAPPGVHIEQLPPVRTRDRQFSALVDMDGWPVNQVYLAKRRARLMAVFAQFRPNIVVTEMFPFGRRAFGAEVERLLEAAVALRPRPWILSSVRDILVKKQDIARYDWMRDLVMTYYDQVLVHTDPRLVPFDLTFPHAKTIASRIINTGYVTEPLAPRPRISNVVPEILVSAGGGRVGTKLIQTAIEARAHSRLRDVPWRLIAGGQANHADIIALRAKLPEGFILSVHDDDFQTRLANCLLSISQAGYNTVAEGLHHGKKMVLVPFETATETEQFTRASRLAKLGLVKMLREADLTPQSLAKAVDVMIDRPTPDMAGINLDGMAKTTQFITNLAMSDSKAHASR